MFTIFGYATILAHSQSFEFRG